MVNCFPVLNTYSHDKPFIFDIRFGLSFFFYLLCVFRVKYNRSNLVVNRTTATCDTKGHGAARRQTVGFVFENDERYRLQFTINCVGP